MDFRDTIDQNYRDLDPADRELMKRAAALAAVLAPSNSNITVDPPLRHARSRQGALNAFTSQLVALGGGSRRGRDHLAVAWCQGGQLKLIEVAVRYGRNPPGRPGSASGCRDPQRHPNHRPWPRATQDQVAGNQ